MKTAIIYTMGKVGSDAMARAIGAAGLPVHHIHTLNKDFAMRVARQCLEKGRLPDGNICTAMHLMQRKQNNPFYISAVREPIARNLSAFFQNIIKNGGSEQSASDTFNLFVRRYAHRIPIEWFDVEFRAYLGIDVFSKPFQPEFGYCEGENWIVFRDDCQDAVKSAVLSERLGSTVTVRRSNDGSAKLQGALYDAVKAVARFERGFLEDLYDSLYVRHFWSDEERAQFIEKWAG